MDKNNITIILKEKVGEVVAIPTESVLVELIIGDYHFWGIPNVCLYKFISKRVLNNIFNRILFIKCSKSKSVENGIFNSNKPILVLQEKKFTTSDKKVLDFLQKYKFTCLKSTPTERAICKELFYKIKDGEY